MVVVVLHPPLAISLLPRFAVIEIILLSPALFSWHRGGRAPAPDTGYLSNPVELRFALGFGVLLSLVAMICAGVRHLIGDQALVGVALLSGIADVDAITISLSRLSHAGVAAATAVDGIVLAAASNNLAKGVMAALIGGGATGWRVALPLIVSATAGVALLPAWY